MKHLNVGDMLQFIVPLPPTIAEQEAIAEALSDADALIESLEQLIAKKSQIKQGAMQELLTGKRRLPGFKVKPGYKQTEVGVIPEDWEVYTLGEIGKFKNGLNKDNQAFGHGSPFVNLMDVFGVNSIASKEYLGLVECTSFEQSAYDLRRGDVIFVRSSVKPSGVGLTVVVEKDLNGTVYSGFLIRFRDGGVIDTAFKKHCFYEEGFRKSVIGSSSVSANTNINQDSLKRLLIPLPPTITEQEAIASILSDMDAEITLLEEKLAKACQLKQGMMQELLTGRVRLI
jgi:type I restriction enzyme S subunit